MSFSRRRIDTFTEQEFAAGLDAEIAQARALYAEGFIRQAWHRGDAPGTCLLLEADSEAHARERLGTLPFMAAGMLEVTIIPLKPYRGFCP